MQVTILGCGTSGGVPRIGNVWGVCDPMEPRNRRLRSSILVQSDTTSLIVDTTPDLREQCLAANLMHLDAALYTHDHADHVNGIDDLRGFMVLQGGRIPVYGDAGTMQSITQRFGYIFASARNYPPIATAHLIDGSFRVGDINIEHFRQIHGGMDSLGFRFGNMAYSTDLSELPDDSFKKLRGLDVWVVDALRPKSHPTHTHLEQTLKWIAELRPKRAILTHMTWDMDYATLCAELPTGVEPAYDGMVLQFS